jgi:predicted ATPase
LYIIWKKLNQQADTKSDSPESIKFSAGRRSKKKIKTILQGFDKNCKNINFKKGIYIYGATGCGKTEFVMNLLKELNYDVIKYDAGDVRNKSLIDTITSNNISNRNVLHMIATKGPEHCDCPWTKSTG